jgi:hypothetical protein
MEIRFMSVNDIPGAIDLIKAWMDQRGISDGVETKPTPNGVFFQFIGKDVTGIPFVIIRPEAWKKTVLIVSEVLINDDRVKSIESMRPKDRDEFLHNLQKDITFAPAQFAFDPTFDTTGIPRSIQFSKEICYDGLTQDRLNDAMRDVVRSALFVIWQIRKEFGNPKKE